MTDWTAVEFLKQCIGENKVNEIRATLEIYRTRNVSVWRSSVPPVLHSHFRTCILIVCHRNY